MKYGNIYLPTDEEIETYGNIKIRTEIEVLGPDIPKIRPFKHDEVIIDKNGKIKRNNRVDYLGWTCTETIGMAVINPRAITKFSMES
jgi:hypothetical protein